MSRIDLRFTPDTYRKLMLYASLCEKEISGLGLIRRDEGVFYCDEVILVDQEVGGSHTDISPDGLSAFMTKIGQERPDTWGKWKVWWHSHVSMGATFSTQDNDTLRELARVSSDWFLGLVINKSKSSTLYIAVQEPVSLLASLDEAVEWRGEEDTTVVEEVKAEIDAHVKTAKPVPFSPTPTGKRKGRGAQQPPRTFGEERASQESATTDGDFQTNLLFEGFAMDSATLGLCLSCGRDAVWREASKHRKFLGCEGCPNSVRKCQCLMIREKGSPRWEILHLYWEEQRGIEEVTATAIRLLGPKTIEDAGRKRRRSGDTR